MINPDKLARSMVEAAAKDKHVRTRNGSVGQGPLPLEWVAERMLASAINERLADDEAMGRAYHAGLERGGSPVDRMRAAIEAVFTEPSEPSKPKPNNNLGGNANASRGSTGYE